MCVVDLGYGKAVVARPELSPVLPAGAVDSLAPVLPASVIASTLRGRPSGTGVTTGSASVSHVSLPGGDANNNAGSSPATAASSARAQVRMNRACLCPALPPPLPSHCGPAASRRGHDQDLAHAVQAMQHERTGTTPTALERQCGTWRAVCLALLVRRLMPRALAPTQLLPCWTRLPHPCWHPANLSVLPRCVALGVLWGGGLTAQPVLPHA